MAAIMTPATWRRYPAFARPLSEIADMDTPTPPAKRYYWEDFTVGRVITLGSTPVTREATLGFAQQFDPQPFHLEDAAAEASLFKRLSASGWHTCAMTMRLMCDGYLNDSAGLGSPGIDELRWLKPVYPGDVISAEMTVLEARVMNSKPHVGLVLSRWRVFNQDGDDVMTMQGWGMFAVRHPAPRSGA
jgi:acyl dehydratase